MATDLSTKEGFIPPANNAAPVRQVKDSEDDATQPLKSPEDVAAQKEQVKANKLARRRKKKAMIAKASEPIEVAKDIPNKGVFELPVVNGGIKCQECSFWTRNQDIWDLHFCQVDDNEHEAVHQPIHKAG